MIKILSPIRNSFIKFRQKEDGVTSIEYAIIAALIFLVIVVSVRALGSSVDDLFKEVAKAFP